MSFTSLKPPRTAAPSPQFRKLPSPEEQDFEDFARLLRENHQCGPIKKFRKAAERWPDKQKQRRFFEWQTARCSKHLQNTLPYLSPRQCMTKIVNTNFLNSTSRAEWHWMMEMIFKSFVIIGAADHGGVRTGYGIEPGPSYLLPNGFSLKDHRGGYLLHHSILSIDFKQATNIEDIEPTIPANTMKIATTHDVVRAPSPMADRFIFAQIGSLWAFRGRSDRLPGDFYKDAITEPGPWDPTGFGVVVQIHEQTGKPGAVYIIYNFRFRDNDSELGDVYRPTVLDDQRNILPHIGRLHSRCDSKGNFTVAKIADSIEKFIPATDDVDFAEQIFQIEPILDRRKVKLSERFISPVREVEISGKHFLVPHRLEVRKDGKK